MNRYNVGKPFKVMLSNGKFAELTEKLIVERQKVEPPEKILRWAQELREYSKAKSDYEKKAPNPMISTPTGIKPFHTKGLIARAIDGLLGKE